MLHRSSQDAPYRPVGYGHSSTYFCGNCRQPSGLMAGRKWLFVRRAGGKTWVCPACVAKGAGK